MKRAFILLTRPFLWMACDQIQETQETTTEVATETACEAQPSEPIAEPINE